MVMVCVPQSKTVASLLHCFYQAQDETSVDPAVMQHNDCDLCPAVGQCDGCSHALMGNQFKQS